MKILLVRGFICLVIYVPINLWADVPVTIIGGQLADNNEYPYAVGLADPRKTSDTESVFCGGSLVGDKWVLTAAHCVVADDSSTSEPAATRPLPANEIEVVIGKTNFADSTTRRFSVRRVILHPQYVSSATASVEYSDIALVELNSTVTNQVVGLASPTDGQNATVVGWGVTSSGDDARASDRLLEVTLPIVPLSTCQSVYMNELRDNMLCAGTREGGKDSCQGDSGGPLLISQNSQLRQAGIVSFGEGCAEPGVYGVYTRVDCYLPWLNTVTGLTFSTSGTISCGSTGGGGGGGCTMSATQHTTPLVWLIPLMLAAYRFIRRRMRVRLL